MTKMSGGGNARPAKRSILACLCLILAACLASAQVPLVPTTAPGALIDDADYIRSRRLGATFIAYIGGNMGQERYRNALILGAGWNRWPLYWDRVEKARGKYDWSAYDKLAVADMRNGLGTNAILLGRPAFWAEGGDIANLFAPIYADGTDSALADKPINPDNPWAQFVHYAVTRYKPGGVLAAHNGFAPGQGIRHWEIWNEPDVPHFWSGDSQAYARLLKTAAVVIKTVDPEAQVIFGGLLYASDQNMLGQVLRIFRGDPLRSRYNWFFDIVAVHSYDDPWRSGWLTKVVQDTLAEFQLVRPVWVNETGVSAWNDYPGPVWANAPEQRQRLATAEQQAHFLIMSAVFAWSKGAETVFYHQLYDDCGNAPPGTDFPPNQGELCASGACYGDAFGLYRNPPSAHCFSQHPLPNTPRPAARAFQLLAEVFGGQPFRPVGLTGIRDEVTAAFFQRESKERIIALWNNTGDWRAYAVQAASPVATIFRLDGTRETVPAQDGQFRLNLAPAGDYQFPDLESDRQSAIGGEPILLLESSSR